MLFPRMRFRFLTVLLLAATWACGEYATEPPAVELPGPALSLTATTGTNVFVNEIHYDNAGTDQGEAIEVAGPAGTDLSGWSLVLYNGATGLVYKTQTLSGVLADVCGGFGFLAISYPVNGIQNGSPDGIALVDASAMVVQFLSYEGTFAVLDGPAAGMTSTDIGVSEGSATPIDNSLQLSGFGLEYEDFTWSPDAPNTFGTCNTGQTFGTPATSVIINELDADNPGIDALEFVELFDGGAGATALDGLVLVFFTGSSDQSYAAFDLDGFSTDADGYFVAGNAAVPGVDLVFADNTLQNGADAAALYVGDAADFPSGTPVGTTDLLDAIVYDTDDADDPGLLVLLNPVQPQVNEAGGGDKDNHSNQRIPNGAGGARNTVTYAQIPPTPGAVNTANPSIDIEKATNGQDADLAPGPSLHVGDPVVWGYVVTNDGDVLLSDVTVTDDQGVTVTCPQNALVAGESMTCTATRAVTWGPYANIGTATGTPPAGLADVSDADPSHYLGILDVDIDIHPGGDPNPVNLGAGGRLPVAILTDADFDAATVDPATVTLGDDDGSDTPVAARPKGSLIASLDDVDDDGDLDLILHFDVQALVATGDLTAATTTLILNGLTTAGLPIQGADSVIIAR